MRWISTLALFCCTLTFTAAQADDEPSLAERLAAAAGRASGEEHLLQYKFKAGEEVKYKVTHLVTVDTTIEGTRQRARTRSVSTKVWKISKVDDGKFTFTHMVADVDMWQKVDRRDEVRYNSQTDENPPPQYEHIAETVGIPLATVTIDASGHIVQREDEQKLAGWGGQLIIPLPPDAVTVGTKWNTPREIKLKLQDGRLKSIKTRQLFELAKVEENIATIRVITQVLTPINDAKVKAQIVQRLTKGDIKFDMEQGRVVSQALELDETVIGFNGPKSHMAYAGRFSEALLPAEVRTAAKPETTVEKID